MTVFAIDHKIQRGELADKPTTLLYFSAFGATLGASRFIWGLAPKPTGYAPANFSSLGSMVFGTMGKYFIAGSVFLTGKTAAEMFRCRKDCYNDAAGGFLVGTFMGLNSGYNGAMVKKAVSANGILRPALIGMFVAGTVSFSMDQIFQQEESYRA